MTNVVTTDLHQVGTILRRARFPSSAHPVAPVEIRVSLVVGPMEHPTNDGSIRSSISGIYLAVQSHLHLPRSEDVRLLRLTEDSLQGVPDEEICLGFQLGVHAHSEDESHNFSFFLATATPAATSATERRASAAQRPAIHNGAVIHHQDQWITPTSLRTRKTTNTVMALIRTS